MADLKDDDEDIAEDLAVDRLTADGADREVASRFLRAKTLVLRKQLAQLHVSNFREWLYAAAETVLGLVILLVFVGLASAVWSAAHDYGLVIESFSVPPDFEARGLSGQVVASQLLDRLSTMQSQTVSHRASSSYTNNWGNDIKVQIPDTGVSIGDVNRYLREWLGNETHISGDVYKTANGITVTARVGQGATASFSGPETDFDKLMQKAAETVYRSTQPYRYAVYLDAHGRVGDAKPVYQELIKTGSSEDQAWAYLGLASEYSANNDYAHADALLRRAIAVNPDLLLPYSNLASNESTLQHDESSLTISRLAVERAAHHRDTSMNRLSFDIADLQNRATVAFALGDVGEANTLNRAVEAMPDSENSYNNAHQSEMIVCSMQWDADCLRAAIASFPHNDRDDVIATLGFNASLQSAEFNMQHWSAALSIGRELLKSAGKIGPQAETFVDLEVKPLLARSLAGLGDIKSARNMIGSTPADCAQCMRIRGQIDAVAKNWKDANYWFARAVAQAPSVPFGYLDWGNMLLTKGDPGGAIAKFSIANKIGPHFADPLESWGEALIAKNRSDLALAKFEEAAKYAPNWGRLHLKWGEALFYANDKDSAQKQFAIASGLDLSAGDRNELTKARNHV